MDELLNYAVRNKDALADEMSRLGKPKNKSSDCRVKVVLSGIKMSPREKLEIKDKMESDTEFEYDKIRPALQVILRQYSIILIL